MPLPSGRMASRLLGRDDRIELDRDLRLARADAEFLAEVDLALAVQRLGDVAAARYGEGVGRGIACRVLIVAVEIDEAVPGLAHLNAGERRHGRSPRTLCMRESPIIESPACVPTFW